MICEHDPKFIDSGGNCIYCRCLAAEAIVNKLPKTADGVPIILGMELWIETDLGNILKGEACTFKYEFEEWHVIAVGWTRAISLCYSTREALLGRSKC